MTGLYVHLPWCRKKCPYCDFNSHELRGALTEEQYVVRLLDDLECEFDTYPSSTAIQSVYFGGGTPSLFQPDSFARLLDHPKLRSVDEITMEVNPGTTEHSNLHDYRAAGITRVSIGVQSFDDELLNKIGRIHDSNDAMQTIEKAHAADFASINLDLMFGLPLQTIEAALKDLNQAIDCQPNHISWYELTIEPNTVFAKYPPPLPATDTTATMSDLGTEMLISNKYRRYEVSAFAREGFKCKHNVNYWRFGDYFGIGAGAHGKHQTSQGIIRTAKVKQPDSYLAGTPGRTHTVASEELPVEFMMNVLRLTDGVAEEQFNATTGLPYQVIQTKVQQLRAEGMMVPNRLQLSPRGYLLLNSVVEQFLPPISETY